MVIAESRIKEINSIHSRILGGIKKTIEDVLDLGSRLSHIHDELPQGAFRDWLKDNTTIPETTARRWIKCYQARAIIHAQNIEGITEAYRLLANPPTVKSANAEIEIANGTKGLDGHKNHSGSPQVESCQTKKKVESDTGWPDIVVAKPGEPTDETGFPLTDTAKKSWAYRDMVQGWLTTISRIKSEVEKLKNDPLFIRSQQHIIANLSSSYSTISDCKPYAVCTECAGEPTKQSGKFCTYCGLTGVISKYAYDMQSRSSVKEIREKAANRRASV